MRHLPPLQIDNLSGGWNTAVPATHIADNEFSDGKNIYLDELAKPTKRAGIDSTGVEESNSITGLFRYDRNDGSDYQVYVEGTDLKYRTTGSGTSVYSSLTDGLRTRFAVMYGALYVCNGTDTPIKWDQTTASTATGMPAGFDCFEHEEKLFTYGMTSEINDRDYPSILAYSETGDPDDWSELTNFVNIGETDGTVLQKCVSDGGRILCWKDSSVWQVTFDSIGDYDRHKILDLGTPAPDSVVKVGNDYFFLTRDAVVSLGEEMSYVGQERAGLGLSAKIKPEINKINQEYIHKAQGMFFDNKYFLAVPVNQSTTNNVVYVYDVIKKVWLPPIYYGVDGDIECWGKYVEDDTEYFYWGSSDGYIYREANSFADDGAAIDSFIETKKYSMYWNQMEQRGRLKTFYTTISYLSEGSNSVSQTITVDNSETSTKNLSPVSASSWSGTIGRQLVGNNEEEIEGTDYYYPIGTSLETVGVAYNTRIIRHLNKRGYTIQFKYENNTINSGFTLQGFAITNSVIAENDFQSPAIKV